MHKVEKASSPLPPSITAVHHSASVIVRSDAAWRKEDKKAGLKCSMQTLTAEVQQKKTMWHIIPFNGGGTCNQRSASVLQKPRAIFHLPRV